MKKKTIFIDHCFEHYAEAKQCLRVLQREGFSNASLSRHKHWNKPPYLAHLEWVWVVFYWVEQPNAR